MAVIRGLPPPTENVWYLAYGSNLSSSKFVKDRGIVPLQSRIVRIPGYALNMSAAGLPYREPSFASIHRINPGTNKSGKFCKEHFGSDTELEFDQTTLLGTAYLVSSDQYKRVLASEGGGIAYREVELLVESVGGHTSGQTTIGDKASFSSSAAGKWIARTLLAVLPRRPAPRPSHRYMVRDLFLLAHLNLKMVFNGRKSTVMGKRLTRPDKGSHCKRGQRVWLPG